MPFRTAGKKERVREETNAFRSRKKETRASSTARLTERFWSESGGDAFKRKVWAPWGKVKERQTYTGPRQMTGQLLGLMKPGIEKIHGKSSR